MDKRSSTTKTGSEKPTRKEISLADLSAMFPDDETARQWLEKNVWQDGRRCPKRGHDVTAPAKNSRMPYRRHGCSRRFSVRTGTIKAHPHVIYRNWVITIRLLATRPRGASSMQLRRDLGIKQSTAWLLHKLRKSWHALTGSDHMSGPAGANEACLGGREKNRYTYK